MSSQNNTGLTWTTERARYFLRDDKAMGIRESNTFSLFRAYPDYGRVIVLTGDTEWVMREAHNYVAADIYERERAHLDPLTLFRDEFL